MLDITEVVFSITRTFLLSFLFIPALVAFFLGFFGLPEVFGIRSRMLQKMQCKTIFGFVRDVYWTIKYFLGYEVSWEHLCTSEENKPVLQKKRRKSKKRSTHRSKHKKTYSPPTNFVKSSGLSRKSIFDEQRVNETEILSSLSVASPSSITSTPHVTDEEDQWVSVTKRRRKPSPNVGRKVDKCVDKGKINSPKCFIPVQTRNVHGNTSKPIPPRCRVPSDVIALQTVPQKRMSSPSIKYINHDVYKHDKNVNQNDAIKTIKQITVPHPPHRQKSQQEIRRKSQQEIQDQTYLENIHAFNKASGNLSKRVVRRSIQNHDAIIMKNTVSSSKMSGHSRRVSLPFPSMAGHSSSLSQVSLTPDSKLQYANSSQSSRISTPEPMGETSQTLTKNVFERRLPGKLVSPRHTTLRTTLPPGLSTLSGNINYQNLGIDQFHQSDLLGLGLSTNTNYQNPGIAQLHENDLFFNSTSMFRNRGVSEEISESSAMFGMNYDFLGTTPPTSRRASLGIPKMRPIIPQRSRSSVERRGRNISMLKSNDQYEMNKKHWNRHNQESSEGRRSQIYRRHLNRQKRECDVDNWRK